MDNRNITLKNIGKNFISLAASQLVNRVLGAAILLVLPRYLGPADYGIYTLAISFVGIFSILASYGLDGLFIKDISRDNSASQQYFCTNIVIKETLSILSILILAVSLYILNYPIVTTWAILILSSNIFMNSIIGTCSSVFRAYEKMEYNAAIQISASIARLLGTLIIIKLQGNVLWMISIIVLTNFAISLIGLNLINNKFFKIIWMTNWFAIIDIFKRSTPFFLVIIIATLQGQISLVMLSKLGSSADVGIFSAAKELINILYMVPDLTFTVLFPVLSRRYYESTKSLISASNLSIKYMVILGMPISAGIYFTAPQVINLIYGKSFSSSTIILQILGAQLCMSFVASILSYVLTAADRIKHVTWANTLSVALHIPLNFWLIPIWGVAGAAFASLICTLVISTYFYVVFKSNFKDVIILKGFAKPLLSTAIMSIIIWWSNINLIFTIILGVITYVIAIFSLKTIDKEELVLLRQMNPFSFAKK